MTVKEFWALIDAIDVDARDDGRFTESEMYDIGQAFIGLNNSQKREIGGWDALVSILKPLDKNGQVMTKGDTFRQWVKNHRYANDEMIHNDHLISGQTIDDISFEDFKEQTEEIKRNLYKQQVKTRDTLNAYRRALRSEARAENFQDMLKECITSLPELPAVEYTDDRDLEDGVPTEAVLMLSDLHIGVKINNLYNTYNIEVARKRMAKLARETVKYCKRNNVDVLHVLGLGDWVHGIIHNSARLEQEVDVIEQITIASEILSETLNTLQSAATVKFYSVTDNHSRAVPSLHDAIEAENYSKLITIYLKLRLRDTDIQFMDNNLDQEIGLVDFANGKTGVFVHGHHDNLGTIVQQLSAFVGRMVDYVFVGHYHNEKVKTFNAAKVYVNGSVVGMDQYAFSKRLFGKPSQTLIIFDGDNIIHHSINLE